ncbi:MAG: undecaprenyl-phosphate alpha-N-acetylglucosaminyl 1-phosphate transferase [Gammaproteobacteria bacterium CG11_big_fil_rev_8_21_14_0_20_46_22]|nr:MAG: undecaprenyl-phosphate alpha-N-acetylglucosaminyl 1-phosphate transferase [Gammaproteobacteria bacterium CG12_big_fil_rev_8_21_14_0_65_46_12]PIR10790.1 MAG: undecaprenyl-phosphate alpha-N-acetylglucosaminyl 1-phosphate transferase [Gammaproteobacteria bacterium CG11_big_fil_rev_8_21_14_0_20_46_22]
MSVLLSYSAALLVTLLSATVLMPVAHKVGLVDKPGGRKKHKYHTPLVGGVSIFIGFSFALCTLPSSLALYRPLLAVAGLLMLIGVADDFLDLKARFRFFIQLCLIVLLVLWSGVSVDVVGFSSYFGHVRLGWFALPFTVVVFVGYINAMNMLDGQDGLAGSVAMVQFLMLLGLAAFVGESNLSVVIALLCCAVLGFLFLNFPFPGRHHAAVFLGDAGSMLLALLAGYFAIQLSQTLQFRLHFPPALMAWVLAYPVFDLISVVVSRLLKGKRPMEAGRDHFHHILKDLGVSTLLSTLVLAVITLLFGLTGIWLAFLHMDVVIYLLGFCVLGLIYLVIFFALERHLARLQSQHSPEM